MPMAIEVVFNDMSIDPIHIGEKLIESHPNHFAAGKVGDFYDKKVDMSKVLSTIRQSNSPHFLIEHGDSVMLFSPIANRELSILVVEQCITSFKDAFNWVRPFFVFDSFISSRVYNTEYEHWQNAFDPLQYEAVGKSYGHLPLISNGLPSPLEKEIIDTSNNPGRRCLKLGYVESIGSVMWIGKTFWELTKANRADICIQDWIDCEFQPFDVIQIKSAETLFVSGEGEQRIIQENLRELLFPTS